MKHPRDLWPTFSPEGYPSWLQPQKPQKTEQTALPTTVHEIYDEPDEEELKFYESLRRHDKSRRKTC